MSLNLKDIVGNIFYTKAKADAEEQQKTANLQQKVNNTFGTTEKPTTKSVNPFLKDNGELFNPLLNYQKILDNPNVSQMAKKYITQATGLTPTVTTPVQSNETNIATVSGSPTQSVVPAVQPNSVGSNQSTVKTDNNIVNSAQKYIGTPYVWGGESMDEGGMDCSGFVYNALKDAGYDVGRTTAQGYRSYGTAINKSEMQPGDLIFYGSGKATHIGIYIGDGKMIHSSGDDSNTKSNPGKGVSVANINYRKDFLEARRY